MFTPPENSSLLSQDAAICHSPLLHSIIAGREHAQSFPNSQYRTGGVSFCGLAALNCVRSAFRLGGPAPILQSLLGNIAADTTNEILSASDRWPGSAHLEVDDLLQLPLFSRSLMHLDYRKYDGVDINQLVALLRQLEGCAGLVAAIIIRSPEIIACLKVPLHDMNLDSSSCSAAPSHVFVIFDSHPRPSYPDGAGWFFSTSLDATAGHLHTLIRVDRRIFVDPDRQWQAHWLLNQFSAHIVAPQEHQECKDADMQCLIRVTSFRILELQAELAEAKYCNNTLESTNKKYEEELDELRSSKHQKGIKGLVYMGRKRLESIRSSATVLHRQSLLSTSSHLSDCSAGQFHHPQAARLSGSLQNTANNIRDIKGKGREHIDHSFSSTLVDTNFTQHDQQQSRQVEQQSLALAASLQEQHEDEVRQLEQQNIALAASLQELQEQHNRMIAIQQQRQYEDEARELEQQNFAFAASAKATFTCGVCMENVIDEDLALIDNCQHQFCRECLQGYALSKIKDRRFPIICPICMNDKAHLNPGTIGQSLIEQMHIPQKDYEIFVEMMLSQYSIPVHCSRCLRTVYVDRDEYREEAIVTCPLPGCDHAWCKDCMQDIDFEGPPHSCDGSNELANLMREKGWKACPGCQTNIQKADGCNHMTCPSPGCNMHFCYRCGQGIIRSALASEVGNAISGHYSACHLFEEEEDEEDEEEW